MISKELLSEVLGKEVTNIQKGCTENELKITAYFGDARQSFHINIYELAHKCKECVISKGYDVLSGGLEAGLYSCYIDYSDKRYTLQMNPLHYEFADTEPEAIFKACQWILDNKENKW